MSSVAVPRPGPQAGIDWRSWPRAIWSNYVVRRIVKAILTIWFVTSLLFFLIRLMPSNPLEIYIQELMSQYSMSYQDARSQAGSLFALDLDAPLWQQYLRYMGGLLHGDLGTSLRSQGTPVTDIIAKFLPWTLFSVGTALMISVFLGVGLGIVMAYRRDSWVDNIFSVIASISSSVPQFVFAVLIIVIGVKWKLLDFAALRGSTSPGIEPGFSFESITDIFYHASLPITVYVLTSVGAWMLSMRNNTLATLGEDYVTVARARGLPDSRIATYYVGRNAALPLVTSFALALAYSMGGSPVVEDAFKYLGIGAILVASVFQRDYSLMQGCFLVLTSAVVIANMITDLMYGVLDPRIRIGGGE